MSSLNNSIHTSVNNTTSASVEEKYNKYGDPEYYLSEIKAKLALKFKNNSVKFRKVLEEAQKTITKQFLQRNVSKVGLCKQMQKKQKSAINKGYTIVSGPDQHSYVTFLPPVSEGNPEPKEEKLRLCMSNFCNCAHTEDEIRKKICILNKFGCCTFGKKCTNDHSNMDVPSHFMLKEGIEYVKDEKKVLKAFFYLHEIRIFKYADAKEDEKTYVITVDDDTFVETNSNTQVEIDQAIDNMYSTICQYAESIFSMSETSFSSFNAFLQNLLYTVLLEYFINQYNNTNQKLPKFAITLFENIKLDLLSLSKDDLLLLLSNSTDECLHSYVQKFNAIPYYNNDLKEYLTCKIYEAVLLHNSYPIRVTSTKTFFIQETKNLHTLSIDDVKITSFYEFNMYYYQETISFCINLLKSNYGFLYQDILGFYFCNRNITDIVYDLNNFGTGWVGAAFLLKTR